MSVQASELRRGMGVRWQDDVWVISESTHVVKGKGKSYYQIELRNAKSGQLVQQRFRVDEKLEQVMFDRRKMEYLYSDASSHVLMDPQSYEQVSVPAEMIGEQSVYLQPNIELEVAFVENRIMSVELPYTVELLVEDTPPQVKGATVTNQLKDAICEGGAKVRVPPFVENGTKIKVDTRSGEYLGRV